VLAALGVCSLFAVLAIAHHRPAQHLSQPAAESLALRDDAVREQLAKLGWDRVRTIPLDDSVVRVSFFNGPRIMLEAAVARDGRVTNTIVHNPGGPSRLGGDLAQRPPVLALLVAVFLLALAVSPVRSLRNLDLLALASFVVPVILMNESLLEASIYTSYPPLAYLCVRCAQVGFRRAAPAAEIRPLVRLRPLMVALMTGAAAVALALLAIPGGAVGDVGFASLAGATELTHGVLPYGHLTQSELVHGDTYPLLAYAAYVPAALVTPVKTGFDQLDAALWAATAFALLTWAALHRLGGLRLALAWLSFPPVVIAASAGSNDLLAAACIAWTAALLACAGRSAAALTFAAWVKLAPFAALPLLVSRQRGRGFGRALLAAGAVTATTVGWLLASGGLGGLGDMADAISFQAERGSLLSLWTLTGADAVQVAVQAAVVALVVAGAVQMRRDRELARDPRRVGALMAAVLLGTQLAANHWTYTYLVWVFPLVALALLRESRPTS
jgi:hypothetical protein